MTLESAEAPVEPTPKPRTSAALRWARLCAWGAFLAVLLGELFGHVWPVKLLTPYTPQTGGLALIGLVLLLTLRVRKRRTWGQDRATLILSAVTAIYVSLIVLGWVPHRTISSAASVSATDANLGTLKLLLSNVHSSNQDHESLVKLVQAENPDVVLLLELNTSWLNDLSALDAAYPYRRVVPDELGNFGMGVWSRVKMPRAEFVLFKVDEAGLLDVPQLEATLSLTDAAGVDRPIRFIGLHPLPPMTAPMAAARDAVLRAAAERSKPDMPTLVIGDFNATRYCRITHEIATTGNLRDTASGLHFSWPDRWSRWVMGIRIDHALASDQFRVVETHRGPAIGSDHRPIVTTVQLVR